MTRDEFIAENMGLVRACARRFQGRGMEYDDLFQAGCMGLVKAVDHFDRERGLQFSTYAVPVILGEMRRLFRDGGTVKVSRGLQALAIRAARACGEFADTFGRAPLLSELADCLQVSEEDAALALGALRPTVSLTDADETQRAVPVEDQEEELGDRLSVQQAIAALPEADQKLITARYYANMTQTQTARQLGMTQVQVSRREKKILLALRELLL